VIAPGRAVWIVCIAAVLVAACARTTRIDREDWGAISPDATIRVMTLDGTDRTLTRVVAFTDALEGFDATAAEAVTIPLDSVEYVETRSGSVVGPVLVAIAAGVTAIAIIDASGKSDIRPEPTPTSCPFLYSFDGTDYVFDSETYAGAVTRGLERTDLDNLDHLRSSDGAYRLLLTNERPETEYTDELSLVVVDHPEGTSVHPDTRGSPRVIADAVSAASATGLRGADYTTELAERDGRIWIGDPLATADLAVDSDLRDGVILDFPRPVGDRAPWMPATPSWPRWPCKSSWSSRATTCSTGIARSTTTPPHSRGSESGCPERARCTCRFGSMGSGGSRTCCWTSDPCWRRRSSLRSTSPASTGIACA
jgi:hypothetical protein